MQWYHRSIHVRRLVGMAAVTVALSLAAWWVFNLLTPPQHNPFKPLDLTLKPGIATGFKLDSLNHDKPACFMLLDQAGVEYTRLDRPSENPECGIDDGLTLDQSLTPYSDTLTMSCRLAAALYVWERHVVIPAAEELLGQGVKRIETMGSYACRRVNSASTGRWSEHAHGEAVDIAGFTLEDGSRILVETDFASTGPRGEFLRRVRDKACGLFSTTLSPDYNALHHNHLHLDMGVFSICS
jgi:hypothetical protein